MSDNDQMSGDIVLVPVRLTGRIQDLPKIGPKTKGHPTLGGTCLLCQMQFEVGDYTTVIPLGPGGDRETRMLARAGRDYEGIGVEAHWSCATGEPDVEIIVP